MLINILRIMGYLAIVFLDAIPFVWVIFRFYKIEKTLQMYNKRLYDLSENVEKIHRDYMKAEERMIFKKEDSDDKNT